MNKQVLYIFIDEGGDFTFSEKGTEFFTLTSLSCFRPFFDFGPLIDLKSDLFLQMVDYFNWAIFRKWERGDSRSYSLINHSICSEFDVFKNGRQFYY